MLEKELIKEERELEELIESLKREIRCAPNGHLRVSMDRGKPLFFHVTEKGDTHGRYLKQKEGKLVGKLAQKSYDMKLLKRAEEQYAELRHFKDSYSKKSMTDIFDAMTEIRKKLVLPRILTDDQFIHSWEQEEYNGKERIPTEASYETKKGEYVRSKSEVLIANALFDAGIPYKYEYPVVTGGGTFYPDFVILKPGTRKTLFWEHFGMMDSEGYRDEVYYKMRFYPNCGIIPGVNLIITMEEKNRPLSTRIIDGIIKAIIEID